MKSSALCLCALFAGCLSIVACSQTTELSRFQYMPSASSVRDRGPSPQSFRVLHSFGGDHDGREPNDLIGIGDKFYGTTLGGGTKYCGGNYGGCGTVFGITPGGKEKVLHNFGNKEDGSNPVAGLIDVDGTLYGATSSGGTYRHGTVFSITLGGKEKVLYSFGAKPDGEIPNGDLIDVDGTLYGTTVGGGTGCGFEGCGTVFGVTTNGTERVLHRFDNANGSDGWYPDSGLADVGGTFYGTTYQGGLHGWGTFFSITRGGKEKVLHNFGKGNDGWYPDANLIDVEGTLYGTTQGGGTGHCGGGYGGCGTVFSVTTAGKERVLHSFNGIDGSFPEASLIDVGSALYGTSANGGRNHCGPYGTCGTVFSITTGGREKVLQSFREGDDGWRPAVRLNYKSGSLFGTTHLGGVHGGGVVFSLRP
jgi:uncharacterized repeat protein (TIGR03803 family)